MASGSPSRLTTETSAESPISSNALDLQVIDSSIPNPAGNTKTEQIQQCHCTVMKKYNDKVENGILRPVKATAKAVGISKAVERYDKLSPEEKDTWWTRGKAILQIMQIGLRWVGLTAAAWASKTAETLLDNRHLFRTKRRQEVVSKLATMGCGHAASFGLLKNEQSLSQELEPPDQIYFKQTPFESEGFSQLESGGLKQY